MKDQSPPSLPCNILQAKLFNAVGVDIDLREIRRLLTPNPTIPFTASFAEAFEVTKAHSLCIWEYDSKDPDSWEFPSIQARDNFSTIYDIGFYLSWRQNNPPTEQESPSNVIGIGGVTRLDIPIESLRDNINWDNTEDALVLILEKDGEFQAYSNRADGRKSLYLASRFAHKYLNGDYS